MTASCFIPDVAWWRVQICMCHSKMGQITKKPAVEWIALSVSKLCRIVLRGIIQLCK